MHCLSVSRGAAFALSQHSDYSTLKHDEGVTSIQLGRTVRSKRYGRQLDEMRIQTRLEHYRAPEPGFYDVIFRCSSLGHGEAVLCLSRRAAIIPMFSLSGACRYDLVHWHRVTLPCRCQSILQSHSFPLFFEKWRPLNIDHTTLKAGSNPATKPFVNALEAYPVRKRHHPRPTSTLHIHIGHVSPTIPRIIPVS